MRSVFLGISACLLAGCATVSMTEGQTTVTNVLAKQQSDLQIASAEYRKLVNESGWASNSGGLFSVAKILFYGDSDETSEQEDHPYVVQTNAKIDAPSIVLNRISADVERARLGLLNVQQVASDVLVENSEIGSRSDVLSFERTLVQAQLAQKSFNIAVSEVARRTSDVSAIDTKLAEFADAIDDARATADQLADKYAAQQSNVS